MEKVEAFLDYVSELPQKFKITALAHNMKGYDGCFILKSLMKNKNRWSPKLITTGTKLISITCDQKRFIDSLNYIPPPLSKFPKTFNLPEVKGYFPHLFNTIVNQNYSGPLPGADFYCADQMNEVDRSTFLKWHSKEVENGVIFDMDKEIVKYCLADVEILRKSCITFWKIFKTENNVDPFQEATTIASACNLVYRRRFLRADSIGIIPPTGYRLADKQSLIAIKWLVWMEFSLGVEIQHAGRAREVRLADGTLVDCFCRENNTVFGFTGVTFTAVKLAFPISYLYYRITNRILCLCVVNIQKRGQNVFAI